MTVLIDIKMAPTAGLNVKPIGARTPAANGIAIKLYPAPHQRFVSFLFVVLSDNSKKASISAGSDWVKISAESRHLSSAPTAIQHLQEQVKEHR